MSCLIVDNTFGPHAYRCRGGLDFTLFFEETILTILPLALVLCISPFRILYLSKRSVKVNKGILLYVKWLAYLLYGVLCLTLVVLWSRPSAAMTRTRASIATAALSFLGSILLSILSYVEHSKAVHPSLILEAYLFFSLLFDTARARTLWLQQHNRGIAIVFIASLVAKSIIYIVEAFQKKSVLCRSYQNYPPEAVSGLLNRSFFLWLNTLFRKGYSKDLLLDDLFSLDKHLKAKYLQHLLESSWAKVLKRPPHALLLMTMRRLRWPIVAPIFPRLCLTAFNFCQPFLLERAIRLSAEPINQDTNNYGYGLIGAYILVYIGIAIVTGQFQHLTYRVITMMRGGLISMLYSRTAKLSITAVDPSASMILMSADIERITTGWQTFNDMWASLIEIALAIFLLERQLGAACAVPIAVAIIAMAGSLGVTGLVIKRQAMWLTAIEKRITATTTMLSSMKGVKMGGLTATLTKSIQDLRVQELDISKRFRKLLIWNMAFTYFTPVAAPILTFAVFSVLARNSGNDSTLDTAKIFTSLSLFTLLSEPLGALIMSLLTFAGAVGSFQRIQDFLNIEDRQDSRTVPQSLDRLLQVDLNSDKKKLSFSDSALTPVEDIPLSDAIVLQNASFGWESGKGPLLDSINMTIPKEKVSMIVGPVGCGKSTLLRAVLGEVPIMGGSIEVCSYEAGFCDQSPWHMNGTIRESIVGVDNMDPIWYETVLHACALEEDLCQLSLGDQTPIGSKGISLSGGQSQRIALARAVYARKSLVILDDVFSGLDADTEHRVFHNILGVNGLLRKYQTTVVITTSSVQRLPFADYIVALQNGKVSEAGTFLQLNAAGGYVSSFNLPPPNWDYQSTYQASNVEKHKNSQTKSLASPDDVKDSSSRGSGDSAVYLYYVRNVGWIPTLIFVVAIAGFIFCVSFPSIWVKWWAADNVLDPNGNLGYYLGIYAVLGIGALLCLICSCWELIINMVPKSGENFHWALLRTVLNAPMSFFSVTDTGVTVNRFSQDLMLIDMELPIAALNTFATFLLVIAQMILIGVASIYAAVAFPVVLVALYFIQKCYLRTSRQLRLLDLESKSPLYSQFMELLSGLATVRAFGWEKALEKKSQHLLNESQKPFYLLFAVQRWLTLVLDLIVAACAVMLVILVVKLRGKIDPGFVGVALLNVIMFSQSIKLLLTFWTNLETHIGSVARIKDFTAESISENLSTETSDIPAAWPTFGAIEFKSVSASYKSNEPVLKSVNLKIEAGQKIGLCGRTGSGKSSLVMTIFRMLDIESGSIFIDGLDIATLPRDEIRSRLIGVPQDSFILNGTVRLNADPFMRMSDSAIIDSLKAVQLWDNVRERGGLDTDIENLHLSHGQRQLFCLSRAMLRDSSILIMDEATSSVDSRTEELMQHIIREKFSKHTIIYIAHKLDSILDYDKIALLDEGQIREFDSPHELLVQPTSAFYRLYYSSHQNNDDFDDNVTLAD
ncbi:P-loop containing nucleoside triphosphate hydrolase protein [Bisporella sp. PMI_857]|nr:P-loop containing nucleoside triphosphate hydrolase protein [Bisporella sp. PMI_857]